jgi:hypothetical protein
MHMTKPGNEKPPIPVNVTLKGTCNVCKAEYEANSAEMTKGPDFMFGQWNWYGKCQNCQDVVVVMREPKPETKPWSFRSWLGSLLSTRKK